MTPANAVRAPWFGAVLAIASATAAFALTLALDLERLPFLIPMLAVLVSALYGGFTAGLLAGIVTIVLVTYAMVEPIGEIRWPSLADAYHLVMFAVVAAVISLLGSRRHRAEATITATLASIGDGVIVADVEGRITFFNTIAERLTGCLAGDAIGRVASDVVRLLSEDTREPIPNLLDRVLRQPGSPHVEERALLIAQDGSERPVSATATAVRDARADLGGTVLVVRDASQQRHAERALRDQAAERERLLEREHAARREAEEANRLKDEFLATLSHELRTPLNAVLGWVHMLIGRNLSGEERASALSAIQRNAQAQARLVDDILDLSRIVTGRLALESQPVDVTEVVASAVEAITPAALAKHLHVDVESPGATIVVGDPHRLRQVAWNLLSNATKFTPPHGTIRTRVIERDGMVVLTVSDNGQGIDPAFLPMVFEPFRQADGSSTRRHAGLGIGLTLVRRLVEAHGGTVSAISDGPNRGTTVTVQLPAADRTGGSPQELVSAARR